MAKLKKILEDIAFSMDDKPKVNKLEVIESVSQYGILGKALYNEVNVLEVASRLSEIAESAHSHIIGESDDWFDKVSVSRNMKHLNGMVSDFKKTAQESHVLGQRLTALYEDMGNVLNRYYDINEDMEISEELKTSNVGFGDNVLDKQAAKSDPSNNKDEKYKYNESVDDTDDDTDDEIEDYLKKPRKQSNKQNIPFKILPTESKDDLIGDAMRETAMNKKSTKRLKDISLVNLAPIGLFKK